MLNLNPVSLNHLVYICSVCAVWQFCICSVAHYTAAPSQLTGHIWNTTCYFCNSYTTIAWLILLEPTIMHCLSFQLANFIKNYDTKLSLNIMRAFYELFTLMPPVGFDASVWKLGELGPLLLILLGKGTFQIVGTEYPMCSPACAFFDTSSKFQQSINASIFKHKSFSNSNFSRFFLPWWFVCLYLIHCHSFEFEHFIL